MKQINVRGCIPAVSKYPALLQFFLLLSANICAQGPGKLPINRNSNVVVSNRLTDSIPLDRRRLPPRDMIHVQNGSTTSDTIRAMRLRNHYPDTLKFGSYTMIVEQFESEGVWNNQTKNYDHLNGIGRIKVNCPVTLIVWPGLWKDAILKPVTYTIVDNPVPSNYEISKADVATLGLNISQGNKVQLMMPHYNDKAIDISRYIAGINTLKKYEGIRVNFKDISASPVKVGSTHGVVTAGTAKYPLSSPEPAIPFTLDIASGFQLEVKTMLFFPDQEPLVNAKLLLPASITSSTLCSTGSLNLGDFRLFPNCEFYKELPDSAYGTFGIGNTTLSIAGKGYAADFSSSLSYISSGKPANWKGVVLMEGESKGSPIGTVLSNIGYMQADYAFSKGIIEASGFTGSLLNVHPYDFATVQPYGYSIAFDHAEILVNSSAVSGGSLFQGSVALPRMAVREVDNHRVVLSNLRLTIKPNMDLAGKAAMGGDQGLYWGDLIKAGGGDRRSFGVAKMNEEATLFFSATPRPLFDPTSFNGKKFIANYAAISPALMDSINMQGATFNRFTILVVNSPNIPGSWNPILTVIPESANPIWFKLSSEKFTWLNVVTEGVHCNISGTIAESPGLLLGDPSKPTYVGVTPFQTATNNFSRRKQNGSIHSSIVLQCVESAVINCDFRSFVEEPSPIGDTMAFKEMVFTSTANNAGGKIVYQGNDSLSYWGLKLVQKPGYSSAGLISVKTGQIILTAAGISETRHFAQPFWLTWGEMLANGSMGRLFFDYNSAGQKFDNFDFIHSAVALSPYIADPAKKSFLRVGGTAFFPFFGSDYLHIKDAFVPELNLKPFNKRKIFLTAETGDGFFPTNFNVAGNWSDGLGIFKFAIGYATGEQDGFLGTGTSLLRNLIGGTLGSTLNMTSRGTCIRIGTDLMDQRAISLGPVANISNITRIWGCVCIKGDGIENMVVGGELTQAVNVSIAARAGASVSAILQVTPALARVTLDGTAYLSVAASLDALVNGHMQLTLNKAQGFIEGEVQGKFRAAEGSLITGSSLEAEGQLNWHLGLDYTELQGMVSLKIMTFAYGAGVGAGFYIGMNAPKTKAWVLVGDDPRFALNMAPLPDNLTGVYGSFHLHEGVNLSVVSGDYDVYVGFGAFMLGVAGPPFVMGNLGGRIHGDILGGLVSAGAYFNMQVLGPIPFGFQGTVGLEACVIWVACGTVDLTIGLNSKEGFYIK